MRLILTRHPEQAGALGRDLATSISSSRSRLQLAYLPLTAQVLTGDKNKMTTAITHLAAGDYDYLLLTSGSTVRALLACGFTGDLGGAKLAVVGPGTARAAQELAGLRADWMPKTQHSASGILQEWLNSGAPGEVARRGDRQFRVLLPQSAQASPMLVAGLREFGCEVDQVTAYETVSIDDPRANQSLLAEAEGSSHSSPDHTVTIKELTSTDVVLITAPSAARELHARRENMPEGVRLLAIGEPTAAQLEQLGWPAKAVLSQPTAVAVFAALEQAS